VGGRAFTLAILPGVALGTGATPTSSEGVRTCPDVTAHSGSHHDSGDVDMGRGLIDGSEGGSDALADQSRVPHAGPGYRHLLRWRS
jgi:hypothetical protein